MNLNNQGNVKIVTLLVTLLGAGTIYLSQGQEIKGTSTSSSTSSTIASIPHTIEKTYNETKQKYVDEPLSMLDESKKSLENLNVTKAMETQKILSITDNKVIETEPQKKIEVVSKNEDLSKLTDQMVANCKLITKEYEKLHQK